MMACNALTRPLHTTTKSDSARFQLNLLDAFTLNPGTEDMYVMPNNKFTFSPRQLSKLLNPKSLSAFYSLGSLASLKKGLKTDCKTGLSSNKTIINSTVTFKDITL